MRQWKLVTSHAIVRHQHPTREPLLDGVHCVTSCGLHDEPDERFPFNNEVTDIDRRRFRTRPTRPVVLVVDDHDDTRELYIQGLGSLGFEAIGAADGQQACRRAWEFRPDIVVTDLTLRGGDGWQLIQELQRDERTRGIPVVLLTGHAATSLRERAEREGCAGFFVKPCLPDELATELRNVLDRTIVDEGDVSTSL